MKQIPAIIQARMSSHRLPGKVLNRILNKPLLEYLIERLEHCPDLGTVVVATSTSSTDDPIVDFCRQQGLAYVRGSLTNVADRFCQAIDQYPCEAFVRVNGDSPLLDQNLIVRGLEMFRQQPCDVVTNIMPRTFPRGQSVEVIRSQSFREAVELMDQPGDTEHITQVFYRRTDRFRVVNFAATEVFPGMHLAIDTPADLARFRRIVERMDRPHWSYGLQEIVALARSLGEEAHAS